MTSQPGSPEANAALVLESFEAVNAGDTKTLLGVVAADIVMHFAEMRRSHSAGARPGNRGSR
jgi:ketosteroid isomerase-like protein